MNRKCPICSAGRLERKSTTQIFTYREQSFEYQQPGDWCNSCGEGVLDNADMEATEPLLHDFRAKVDGYLQSSEVRRIRRKLKLTQKDAAHLFGGGHNAFSRYERGVARQSRSTDNLLRLLDRHPDLFSEIKRDVKQKTEAA